MSENRCYKTCKIVKDLKSLCLDKEKEISKLINKIETLEDEIDRLKSENNKQNNEIDKEEKTKPKKKPPKVIGV